MDMDGASKEGEVDRGDVKTVSVDKLLKLPEHTNPVHNSFPPIVSHTRPARRTRLQTRRARPILQHSFSSIMFFNSLRAPLRITVPVLLRRNISSAAPRIHASLLGKQNISLHNPKATQIIVRSVASQVSGRPGSQTIGQAATNIKEEVGNSTADLAKTIAGGNYFADAVQPNSQTFVSPTQWPIVPYANLCCSWVSRIPSHIPSQNPISSWASQEVYPTSARR